MENYMQQLFGQKVLNDFIQKQDENSQKIDGKPMQVTQKQDLQKKQEQTWGWVM